MTARDAGFVAWLRDRVGWPAIARGLADHRAPRRSFFFYLGGITLFLLAMQATTGILLALYYAPDASRAHESIERLVGEIPNGTLMRAVHAWAGDLFVASLFAHLFTVVVRRTFRPPHELTWLSGVAALGVGIALAFTGAILPWNEVAYAQARVGSELARHVPLVGEWLARMLRGGDDVTASTLGRAFGFHVAVLPAALTAIVASHLFFLSRKPANVAGDEAPHETIPLMPDFLVRQGVALVGVFIVVMTLAIFVERPLGEAADPRVASSAGAHPPWYFLPAHAIVRDAPRELLGIEGARFLVGVACLLGVGVAALPFLDPRGSRLTAWIAAAIAITLLLLGLRGLA